ncbi:MAG: GAF domain-containing protein [Pleurocapsa sp. MO_192.B19]|nr:GAF domain-containing protein [Pleurocapsa sp. MO_192.B19]
MTENSDRNLDRELVSNCQHQNQTETELNTTSAIALAQEISRELLLDKLLIRLLEILRQTTKARRICLLEKPGDRWLLIASYNAEANETKILPPAFPLEIPTAIINYIAKTGSSLILENAINKGEFVSDSDVKTQQLKSILCAPLLERDFNGVLYLENNSIAGAFTPQLDEYLKIITAQAAIAIANARQYQQVANSLQGLEQQLTTQTQSWQQSLRDREASLQASQAELSGILDIAKDAIISVDSSQSLKLKRV